MSFSVTVMTNDRLNASVWRRAMEYACDFMRAYPNRPAGENIALSQAFQFGERGHGKGEFRVWYTPARSVRVRVLVHVIPPEHREDTDEHEN